MSEDMSCNALSLVTKLRQPFPEKYVPVLHPATPDPIHTPDFCTRRLFLNEATVQHKWNQTALYGNSGIVSEFVLNYGIFHAIH